MAHIFSRLFLKRARAYLDWASAAPVHPGAQRAFERALSAFGNPSSPHQEGRQAKEVLEESRTRIARLAGVKPRAVIFTSGATEANNLALQGRIERLHSEGMAYEAMHVLYLPTMHASVLGCIEELAKLGVQTEPLVLSNLAVNLEKCEKQLRPETVLICVDAVCGETGTRFDTLRLRRAIDARKTVENSSVRPLLHVDASQLPLVEPIERTRLGADLLTLDAQKVGGIRGIGALIIPDARQISAIMQGGGQEVGLRPGTEPVALAAAFAATLETRAARCEEFAKSARSARAELTTRITSTIPQAVVNESPEAQRASAKHASHQAPHILNISLPGFDTDYAVTLLDTAGFAVSTKSACETDSEDGSKAILAFTGDERLAASTLRISWGPETRPADLRRFSNALDKTISFLARK